MGLAYDYVWYWRGSWWRPIYRKGQRCAVVARGKRNTIAVLFPDGFWTITSRWAVRRAA